MELVPSIGIEAYGSHSGWKRFMTWGRTLRSDLVARVVSKCWITGHDRSMIARDLIAFCIRSRGRAPRLDTESSAVNMFRGSKVPVFIVLSLALSACSVGPGTPLIVALKADKSQLNGNVPKPKGYGPPVNAGVSSGLINPEDREETATYLESLTTPQ